MNAPVLRLALALCSPADTFPATLRDILQSHPGDTAVEVQASAPEWGPFGLRFGERFGVRVSDLLLFKLDTLEGVEVLEHPPTQKLTPKECMDVMIQAVADAKGLTFEEADAMIREETDRTFAPATETPTPSVAVAVPAPVLDPAPAHNAPQRRFPKVPADVEAFASAMRTKPGMVLEAIHEYTHPNGSPWWWVARWKDRATGEKMPRPFHRTPAGDFAGKMPDLPTGRPLYRGHRLSQNPSDLVYLVEGELCADCLESVGILAVTWPNGAQSVGKVDWSALAGRDVVLWPDNDAPGLEAMQSIRGTLERLGAVVLVVDVAALALPPKGDVVDWLRRFLEQHGARRVSDLPSGRDLVADALAVLPNIDGMEAEA